MNKEYTDSSHNQINVDEVDLVSIIKIVWEKRRFILKTVTAFFLIGLIIAIFSQKEYTASATIVPSVSEESSLGSLGGIAAMAGINLGSLGSGEGISPVLYPEIMSSIPFQKELLQTPITIQGYDEKLTFSKYYENVYSPGLLGYLKEYTIGLPGLIVKTLKSKFILKEGISKTKFINISEEEKALIELLEDQLTIEVNDTDGFVKISAKMPESLASAELTQHAQELLQKYIIEFKVKKSNDQLQFVQNRYSEKEKEFNQAQQQLASYRDRNRYSNSALSETTLDKYQSQYDLAFGVYSELAKQLEAQKIQVKEDTPVFTVIKPVHIPYEKSKPKRPLILIVWTFFGFIIGISIVFVNLFLSKLKEKWIDTDIKL